MYRHLPIRPFRLPRSLAVAVCALLIGGCSTLSDTVDTVGGWMGRDAPKSAPLPEIEQKLDVTTLWTRQIGDGADGQFVNLVPDVSGDRIYAAGRGGRVFALDAASGSSLWEIDLDTPLSAGPGSGDGLVVVGGAGGEVIALNAAGGDVAWRSSVNAEILSVPRVVSGAVVVQGSDGSLHALEQLDGSQRWVSSRTLPVLTLRGTSSPALVPGGVIAGFANGKLVAYSLAKGTMVWEASVGVAGGRSELERMIDVDADPLVVGPALFAGAYQSRVVAMAVESGRVAWSKEISTHSGFAVDRSQLYLTDDEGRVWALSPRDGGSLWKQEALEGRVLTAPAELEGYLAVGDQEGNLHWLDARDGSLVGRESLDKEGIQARPVAAGGRLYVLGRGGVLTALSIR
ncbi:outer membrane protein assembly factor BamB [Endothiovibrio diazotrophicus]